MFRVKNRVKSLSLLVAFSLALFGIQTVFVNQAFAMCSGFCVTYPTLGQTFNLNVGTYFSMQMVTSGGVQPISNTDISTPLPAGLTLSASGQLSGTPTTIGTTNENLTAYDSTFPGPSNDTVFNVHLVISAALAAAVIPDPPQKSLISGISPASGPTAGGTSVTISGSFPSALSAIHINDVAIAKSTWTQTATNVTIVMPAHAIGAVSIQLYNGQAPILAGQAYTYTDVVPTPTPTPTPSATPTPTPTPSATPTPTPTPSATPTPTPTPSATPTPTPTPKLALKAVVNFGNDSSVLDASAKSAIEQIANKINNSSVSVIYLYGYTDARGDAAYNLGLSKRRATAVSNYLSPLLTNLSLQVAWRGAKNPVAAGNTEADYAKNRRVEIWAK